MGVPPLRLWVHPRERPQQQLVSHRPGLEEPASGTKRAHRYWALSDVLGSGNPGGWK